MSNAFVRRIEILKLIGLHNQKKGLKEIYSSLKREGIEVDIRTLQRDMKSLSSMFDIENDGNKDKPGWSWKKESKGLSLPSLSPSVALTFKMAEQYLKKVFPYSILNNLNQYFNNADSYLKTLSDNKLSNWDKKVAIISRKQPFIVPDIGEKILAKVYDGVLNEKQLSVCYQPQESSEKNYNIHPLGIVMVDEVIYLVGTIWKYTDIRQFALHRFISVENTEENIIPIEGFDLREYQQSGNFGFPVDENKKEIELELMVAHWVADLLNEQALSTNQKITETDSDSSRPCKVTATVLNTAQLRWWLSHFVVNVEIIGPVSLRNEFKENANLLAQLYKGND